MSLTGAARGGGKGVACGEKVTSLFYSAFLFLFVCCCRAKCPSVNHDTKGGMKFHVFLVSLPSIKAGETCLFCL